MMDKLKKLMQAEIEMGEKQIADVNRRLDVLRAAYAALTEPTEKPRRGRPKGSTSITTKKVNHPSLKETKKEMFLNERKKTR